MLLARYATERRKERKWYNGETQGAPVEKRSGKSTEAIFDFFRNLAKLPATVLPWLVRLNVCVQYLERTVHGSGVTGKTFPKNENIINDTRGTFGKMSQQTKCNHEVGFKLQTELRTFLL